MFTGEPDSNQQQQQQQKQFNTAHFKVGIHAIKLLHMFASLFFVNKSSGMLMTYYIMVWLRFTSIETRASSTRSPALMFGLHLQSRNKVKVRCKQFCCVHKNVHKIIPANSSEVLSSELLLKKIIE